MGILRLVLAISVVITHSESIWGVNFVGGKVAVQSFYIISGFYMSLILNEKYIGKNNSYKLYMTNRLLRLYPIYWTVLILTVLFGFIVFQATNGQKFPKIDVYIEYYHVMDFDTLFFLVFTNIFLFFQDIVLFLGLDTLNGQLFFTENFRTTSPKLFTFLLIPPAWTLGMEITFYLIAPFIVRKKLSLIFMLLALTFLLRIYLSNIGLTHDPWNYRFFPTELRFFLLGILSYHIYKRKYLIKTWLSKYVFAALCILTLAYQLLPYAYSKEYFYFTIFFISIPYVFQFTKNSKIDRYIGELSYPVYISHILVILILKQLNIHTDFKHILPFGLIVVLTTLLLSMGLNKFVANKIEKIRQGRVSSGIQ